MKRTKKNKKRPGLANFFKKVPLHYFSHRSPHLAFWTPVPERSAVHECCLKLGSAADIGDTKIGESERSVSISGQD